MLSRAVYLTDYHQTNVIADSGHECRTQGGSLCVTVLRCRAAGRVDDEMSGPSVMVALEGYLL